MFAVGYLNSPIGIIKVKAKDLKIVSIDFVDSIDELEVLNEVVTLCLNELQEYFLGKRKVFTFEYELIGTDFQKAVWNSVSSISYGDVTTYTIVAKKIEKEKGIRAVANAIGRNRLLIVVPCHRILRKDSSLGGYVAGIQRKKYLLELENKYNQKFL